MVGRTERQTSKLLHLLQDAASSRKPPLSGPPHPWGPGFSSSDASSVFPPSQLLSHRLGLFTHLHPHCVMSPLLMAYN